MAITGDPDVVRTTWPRRLWHGLVNLFKTEVRQATPEESRLRDEVETLRVTVDARDREVLRLGAELEIARNESLIYGKRVEFLTTALELDRVQLEAWQAKLGGEIARHTTPVRTG